MNKLLAISAAALLAGLMAGCAQSDDTCPASMEQTKANGGATWLLVGDSISLGYGPALRAALPAADIQHAPCNSYGSRNQLSKITGWLAARPHWDRITFNAGIWDLTDDSEHSTTRAEYEANLRTLAVRIKGATSHPIFITTTEIPAQTPHRTDAEAEARNVIALRVMSELSIPVIDLHAFSHSIAAEHVRANAQDDVHWTEQGSFDLASEIINQGGSL